MYVWSRLYLKCVSHRSQRQVNLNSNMRMLVRTGKVTHISTIKFATAGAPHTKNTAIYLVHIYVVLDLSKKMARMIELQVN